MSETTSRGDRKLELHQALTRVLKLNGVSSPEGATAVNWPLVLVDACVNSESEGDAPKQDELIEAIATILGLSTDKPTTIPEAVGILSGEGARSFIIGALAAHAERGEADTAAEAYAYAIELVNLSALPSDNDQTIGELVTPDDAKMLIDVLAAVPKGKRKLLEEEGRGVAAFNRRMMKLAGRGRE